MSENQAKVTPAASAEPETTERVAASAVDASCRRPVLLMFTAGSLWSVVALLLLLIASIKMHGPGFLADSAWLTFGRVKPAGMNALLYGFLSQVALAVGVWLLCRLGRVTLRLGGLVAWGAMLWNVTVALGVLGILRGGSTGFRWMEMPAFVPPLLLLAYTMIGASALATFTARTERNLYVSTWFVVAALFWFPWLYSAAWLLLLVWPVRGVMQAVVNAWFTGNFLWMWLGSLGLAAVFYLLPRLADRPLYSRSQAAFGFWTLAFVGQWSGVTQLVGGPVPAWLVSFGIAAQGVLLVPMLSFAYNWHRTLEGRYREVAAVPAGALLLFGMLAWLVSEGLGILLAFRSVSAVLRFTYVGEAQVDLALLGFVALVLTAAVQWIVPRLTRLDWPSPRCEKVYRVFTLVGVLVLTFAYLVGGLVHGAKMSDPTILFTDVVRATVPFVGLATAGWLLLLIGHGALAWHMIRVVLENLAPAWETFLAWLGAGTTENVEVRS